MKKHRKTLVHAAFSELRPAVLTMPGMKRAFLRCTSSNNRPSSTDDRTCNSGATMDKLETSMVKLKNSTRLRRAEDR